MNIQTYRVSFIINGTLHIKTVDSFTGEEAAATLIMKAHNCPRTAITNIRELNKLQTSHLK